MSSFGSSLRQRREQQGVPLEDISAATRVGVRYLESLEADDFSALPGGVFNRGIVRGYARCLDLDEHQIVEDFVEACRRSGLDETEQNWGEFAQNVSRQRADGRRRRARWFGVAAMVTAVLIATTLICATLIRRGVVSVPKWGKSADSTPVTR